MSVTTLWKINVFLEVQIPIYQVWFMHNFEKHNICNINFDPIRYLIMLKVKSYVLPPNKTKYQVPSWALINPSILSNIIRRGSEQIKVLYEML